MARPSKAKSGAWRRWKREKALGVMKKRITSTLKRTLCINHFFLLNNKKFEEELVEVADILNDSPNWAEEEVFPYFPEKPEVLTSQLVQDFATWLRSDKGEPLRHEGLQWCEFLMRVFEKCSVCRGGAVPLTVTVPEPDVVADVSTEPRLKEQGESSTVADGRIGDASLSTKINNRHYNSPLHPCTDTV